MDHFSYRGGELYAEDVPMRRIAEAYGTPAYVYSKATLLGHFRKLQQAFAELDPLICYSVKCLGNLSVLRLLAQAGSGFDVVSGGELFRALKAGGDPAKVVFAGVGKTDQEILQALDAGIGYFNVESEMELANLERLCGQRGAVAHGALRVNPDVESAGTHAKTLTGKRETKFGVDVERAAQALVAAKALQHVRLDAIHMHIGSPIKSVDPYVAAISKGMRLIADVKAQGVEIRTFDVGGGFAAMYEGNEAPSFQTYADAIVPLLRGSGLSVILEPGRAIACNAGLLLTEVQYLKRSGEKRFAIVDAAMTELIRPTLYDAYHFAWPVCPANGMEPPSRRQDVRTPGDEKVDIVGPVCETGDYLARDRHLPPMGRGDLLAVFSAGAYGSVMGSQYNARPRAAEVLVDGDRHHAIRRRETYEDLIQAEVGL